MPRGDKSTYTTKQKRKARHIEESYENRGIPAHEAERRAWATVNKDDGGGKRSGAGRGKTSSQPAAKKSDKPGGSAAATRTGAQRSASTRKAARTRTAHSSR